MIGMFTFDGPLYCDINGVYCNTTVTNQMLSRYLFVVEHLYVVMRTIHIDKTYEEAKLQKLELEGIEIIELPNFNTLKNFVLKFFYKCKLKKVVLQTDLFFLRIPSIISNMVADLCLKNQKKYLVEVGGCAWDSYWNHSFIGKICAPYMYFSQRRTIKYASYASYVTTKWLQDRYPTKGIQIVASNVYLKSFDEEVVNKRIMRVMNPNYVLNKVGTIAAVDVRYKGQEYVIRALGKLKKEGIRLEYELVGVGSSEYLTQIAKECNVVDQIHFLGLKLHDDIWQWLDSIDIYIQPSLQEGLPRAVIEAMNRGCICLGSDTAGIPELIEKENIFQRKNVNQICELIIGLLKSRNYEEQVITNYEKSKTFSVEILDARRRKFFLEYKKSIFL